MKNISHIEFYTETKEERLPGFTPDFPYIASCAQLDKYRDGFVPWHWHKPVELFYMESGAVEYCTPQGSTIFRAGAGGMVNSNILHMTRPRGKDEENIQLNHIFDPSFIAGEAGSRIEKKYVVPITAASQLEIIALYPDDPQQARVLGLIRESFRLREQDDGYELQLRAALSEIWLALLALSRPLLKEKQRYSKTNERIKPMMIYIHEHYAEKISIAQLAAATFSSERECFRLFHNCLHMTPVEYIKSYRLQMACQMLARGREPVTSIAQACGLGSSSYFGKVFREQTGCTPSEYRQKWQDHDSEGQC